MSTEYMETDASGEYVGYDEHLVYTDPDWEDPAAPSYVEDGTRTPAGGGGGIHIQTETGDGSSKPFTTIARGNGTATVRSNVRVNFRGSIPFNGQVEGYFPPGVVFRGKDANGNGIPDILEKQKKKGTIWF